MNPGYYARVGFPRGQIVSSSLKPPRSGTPLIRLSQPAYCDHIARYGASFFAGNYPPNFPFSFLPSPDSVASSVVTITPETLLFMSVPPT